MPIITLTTDFGHKDAYVGAMKGKILGINPRADIVDLSHDVTPHSIREGAFVLASAYPHFPKGTIHVVVVDPGVGGSRKLICVRTRDAYFLAPDNGVLTTVFHRELFFEAREISSSRVISPDVSATFHGRDILAPAAAHLSLRDAFAALGRRVSRVNQLDWAGPVLEKKRITGEVIYQDRFGNLVTNIEKGHLSGYKLPPASVFIGKKRVPQIVKYYSEARHGELMLLQGSSEYLEVALREASAAKKTKAEPGTKITLNW